MDLDELYKKYVADLYRYLYSLSKDHYTAEDLVQETFYRAYLHYEFDNYKQVKAWLFKVAYHVFIDYNRKHKRVIVSDRITELPRDVEKEITPEKQLLEKEGLSWLLEQLATLRVEQQQAILLCDVHKFSYQEAAAILDMNLNTFKSHLGRGRKKMIQLVRKRGE